MSTADSPELRQTARLEMAHVLFMDVVGYSKLPMDHQKAVLQTLQTVVLTSPEFLRAEASREIIRLPTGDGMALVFFDDAEAAARCALEVSRALKSHPEVPLRMGLHSGPVYRVADINANQNVAGGGINIAQRVMDCGDAGHILTSQNVADVLGHLSSWKACLHDLGEAEVKHGVRVHLFNLFKDDVGNPELPHKLLAVQKNSAAERSTEQSHSLRAKLLWVAAALVAVLLLFLLVVATRTAPVSGPLAMEQLTFSSEPKSPPIVTDGSRIYFNSENSAVEMSVKGGGTAPIRAAIGTMSILDISPDGSEFLLLQSDLNDETQRGTIWTMPVLGGSAKRLGNITARGASYSPDGKLIAFNEKQSVYVCDISGQNVKEIWNTHHMVSGNPAISPDSSKIRVTVSRSSLESDLTKIWELNVDGGNPHQLPTPQGWPEDLGTYNGIWTPGGNHFVFSAYRDASNNLYEYVQPPKYAFWSKPYAVQLTPGQPEVTGMAPTRDGSGMFVVGRLAQGSLHYYDEKEKRFLPYLGGLSATQLVVSPDRKWMAYTDFPRGFLWRSRLDGSEKLQLSSTFSQTPTWSPDSKWLVYSDWSELYRVNVESGAAEKLTSEGFTEVLPNWSPEGRSIYFNDYPIPGHYHIRVLDLDTRKISDMPGSDGYYAPLWSPDGQYLAAVQNPPKSLAVYSVQTKQWKQLKVLPHDWGFFAWAPDSRSLYVMRGPTEADVGEQTGIYHLTVPDGKWELFAKFTGLNPIHDGIQDFVSVTPDGHIATLNDNSVTQIYQMKWKNEE